MESGFRLLKSLENVRNCCYYVELRRICNCCLNDISITKNRIVCPRITDKNFNENSNYDRFSLYVESISKLDSNEENKSFVQWVISKNFNKDRGFWLLFNE